MQVTLKLYATLAVHLPAGVKDHALALDLPGNPSPHQVLDVLNVPHARAHLLLVNGHFIPPERRDEPLLVEGDVVAAWPPVAGG